MYLRDFFLKMYDTSFPIDVLLLRDVLPTISRDIQQGIAV